MYEHPPDTNNTTLTARSACRAGEAVVVVPEVARLTNTLVRSCSCDRVFRTLLTGRLVWGLLVSVYWTLRTPGVVVFVVHATEEDQARLTLQISASCIFLYCLS